MKSVSDNFSYALHKRFGHSLKVASFYEKGEYIFLGNPTRSTRIIVKLLIVCLLILITPFPVIARPVRPVIVKPTASTTAPAPTTPAPTPKPKLKAAVKSIEITKIPTEPPSSVKASSPVIDVSPSVEALIHAYSEYYNFDVNLALRISKCESGWNPKSKNKSSTASGSFQFLDSTWVSTRKAMGENPSLSLKLDPEQGVKTGIWKLAHGGLSAWSESRSCWNR